MRVHLPDLAGHARRRGLVADWNCGPALGLVLVSGADSGTFLQSQLTSDVLGLQPGAGQLSARLNRRGQLLAWFSLHRLPDRGQPFPSYLVVMPAAGVAGLVADLGTNVISEDVLLDDVSADFGGWYFQLPVSAAAAGDPADVLGPPPGPASHWFELAEHALVTSHLPDGTETWVVRRSLTGDPGCLVLHPGGTGIGPVAERRAEWAQAADLVDLDTLAPDLAAELWGWLEAEGGWPRLGRDLPSATRVLPQTGLEQQVVSYNKGCYLGQEVVARLRAYGSVPEALRAVVWRDLEPEDLGGLPTTGSPCVDPAGAKLGTWAGSFWSPVLQRAASLVFLGRDHRTPGRDLAVAGGDGDVLSGEVALVPLHRAANVAELAGHLHDQALEHFSAGRDEQAVELLEQALRLDPTGAEAFEALGVILGRQEKYHEAIDIFRRLEEIAPEEPMVHTNLSLFYMKIGEKDEAERQKAFATMKKFGVTVDGARAAEMAAEEERLRREDAARKKAMFAEVLDIDPDDPLALMGMGQALDTLGETAAAVSYLQRALAGQPDNSALHAVCGRVLEKMDRTAEAAAVFRQGIAVASRKGDLMPLREMEHRLRLLAQS